MISIVTTEALDRLRRLVRPVSYRQILWQGVDHMVFAVVLYLRRCRKRGQGELLSSLPPLVPTLKMHP